MPRSWARLALATAVNFSTARYCTSYHCIIVPSCHCPMYVPDAMVISRDTLFSPEIMMPSGLKEDRSDVDDDGTIATRTTRASCEALRTYTAPCERVYTTSPWWENVNAENADWHCGTSVSSTVHQYIYSHNFDSSIRYRYCTSWSTIGGPRGLRIIVSAPLNYVSLNTRNKKGVEILSNPPPRV